ncbi:hypothetical protein FQN60_006847 [Etheostoma spectabile]|uniref:Insulin-like growth factor-binding protein 2 n=1 Tax=Etheostoma spectabile TaxID=54343 RepID=A0A5J5CCU5_9PERO|nr:hypothetical protein FQN60_006847 [Etheostoma spectabile]
MLSYAGCSLLILCASLAGASLAEMVFRCPGCTAERQALCPRLTETCAEIVREPGCGCCPVCARQEGEMCGVYTPRCSTGLRCYPTPDSELPLEQLVQGQGQCRRKVDTETTTFSQEHREQTSERSRELKDLGKKPGPDKGSFNLTGGAFRVVVLAGIKPYVALIENSSCPSLGPVQSPREFTQRCRWRARCLALDAAVCTYVPGPVQSLLLDDCFGPESLEGEAVEALPEQGVSEIPAIRKPSKETTWLGPKESAVRQHRQEMKTKMKTNKVEETQCQQELDQILERISKMPFRDNRGPLEDLYALHIPNCDKRGQYNLKQCKMSLHGQRGECWCVNPHTGRPIPSAPIVRGDPNCSLYLTELELELPDMAQI